MHVYLIGSGSREHSIARKLVESVHLQKLICAPGNPGIARLPKTECVGIQAHDVIGHIEYMEQHEVNFVIPGPEAPICAGISNMCRRYGIPVCAPSEYAARLEGSKLFAKQFMAFWGLPTARMSYGSTEVEVRNAIASLGGPPVVLKADGLCAGKGVFPCYDDAAVEHAISELVRTKPFGRASDIVLVEEFLEGNEVSYLCLTDGSNIKFFPPARDYKRLNADPKSPNTGGMASHSPTGFTLTGGVDENLREIIRRVVAGMRGEGIPFVGILYTGFMLTSSGPKILEFNVRFGDPEAQVIIPRLAGDLLNQLYRAATGGLDAEPLRVHPHACASIVVASEGYPDAPRLGRPITGIEDVERLPDVWVDYAGTKIENGILVSADGRVLSVGARGNTVREAIERAQHATELIQLEGKQVRMDISAS